MAKKYYVVWQGRETGIFTDWNTRKKQVEKFAGARYKSFPTKEEAEAAFSGGSSSGYRAAGNSASRKAPTRRGSSSKGLKTYTAVEIDPLIETKIFTDFFIACVPRTYKVSHGWKTYTTI